MSGDGEQPESQDNTQEESAANDLPADTLPDNLYVDENGDMFLTTPEGETLRYTKIKDGIYDCPTESQSGARVNSNDGYDDNVRRIAKEEDIKEAARVYKEEEQQRQQAAQDALKKVQDEEEAKKDREWQAKADKDKREVSQLSKEQIEYERRYWAQAKEDEELDKKRDYVEMIRDKRAHGDKSINTREGFKRAIKKDVLQRTQIDHKMEGGFYEQEEAQCAHRIVSWQEAKFGADTAVMTYGMLSHDPVLPNAYNAATNYTGTLTDAYVNNKDLGKAAWKATKDTALDAYSNYLEAHGAPIIGNTFSSIYKQVNDNEYNGRDTWEDTDKAAVQGAVIGTVSHGIGKANELSQGTALGTEIGNIGPNTRVDFWNKPKVDAETGGIGKTNLGQGSEVSNPKTNLGQEPEINKPKTNLGQEPDVSKPKPDAEPKPESAPKPDAEPKPESTAKPGAEPKPESGPKPDAEPKPESGPKPDAEPKPESTPKPDAEPKPESTPKPDAEPKLESAPDKPKIDDKNTGFSFPNIPKIPELDDEEPEKTH